MAADPDLVSRWVLKLGTVCAHPASDDPEIKAATMTELLCEEFQNDAFTPSSLAYVAKRHRFFPAFAEAAAALSEWRKLTYSTQTPRLTADDPEAIAARIREAERAEWNRPGVAEAAIERVRSDLAADLAFALNAARVLRVTLERHAPHHVPAIDAMIKAHTARPAHEAKVVSIQDARPAWKPASVTPEQLAKLRQQAGIIA